MVHEGSDGRIGQQAEELVDRWHQRCWILLGALAAVLRPPCALFWALLGLHSLAAAGWSRRALGLLLDALGIVAACLAASTLWDCMYYGRQVWGDASVQLGTSLHLHLPMLLMVHIVQPWLKFGVNAKAALKH